jgi:hypothetical protein
MAFNFGAYYLTNWSPTCVMPRALSHSQCHRNASTATDHACDCARDRACVRALTVRVTVRLASRSYYKDVLGVPPAQAALHLMLPHLTNLAAKSANPMLVGALASRGYSLLASRKAFTCAGFVLAASVLSLVPLLRHSSVWGSTLLFSAANACFGLAPSGFKANYLDVTEEYVGLVAGYGNTLVRASAMHTPAHASTRQHTLADARTRRHTPPRYRTDSPDQTHLATATAADTFTRGSAVAARAGHRRVVCATQAARSHTGCDGCDRAEHSEWVVGARPHNGGTRQSARGRQLRPARDGQPSRAHRQEGAEGVSAPAGAPPNVPSSSKLSERPTSSLTYIETHSIDSPPVGGVAAAW